MMVKCLGNAIKTCEFGQNSGKVGTIFSQNCPLLTTWHKCGINLVIRGFDELLFDMMRFYLIFMILFSSGIDHFLAVTKSQTILSI